LQELCRREEGSEETGMKTANILKVKGIEEVLFERLFGLKILLSKKLL